MRRGADAQVDDGGKTRSQGEQQAERSNAESPGAYDGQGLGSTRCTQHAGQAEGACSGYDQGHWKVHDDGVPARNKSYQVVTEEPSPLTAFRRHQAMVSAIASFSPNWGRQPTSL